jgi:Tc toxin complex TcA C-terminal TcB-binding domain
LSGTYFQSYQLAYDVAKRAERAYRYELGLMDSNFIQFGYWDSLKKGLLSGERLDLDLKRMDVGYLEQNQREYEITKHISLNTIYPICLIELRENAECFVSLPEALFDVDYPGHYMRRIKSVSMTIPCVTGPYAGINCTLTQLNSSIRHANTLSGGKYGRRERFLPFEGQGAVSSWRIQLQKQFQTFDYDTISDVILHVRYTSRNGGDLLKDQAISELTDALNAVVLSAGQQGFARAFNLRHEFPTDWYRFLNRPPDLAGDQTLKLGLDKARFPFFFQAMAITINTFELFVKIKPDFAPSYTKDTLKITLQPGTTASSSNVLTISPWNSWLRGDKPAGGKPGDWTLAAWQDTGDGEHKRINAEAIADIVCVCVYTVAAP